MAESHRPRLLTIIGPGILVAATGVGAGDLATGAIAGSKLGLAVLWAVVLGAGLKFILNEGLARWQLATGDTLLEGCVRHFGRWVQIVFLGYLLVWSYFVGSALMSACGVTAAAIFPGVLREPIRWTAGGETSAAAGEAPMLLSGKILFGLAHSLLAVVLVRRGGYRLFEKVMSVCIALMFVTVVLTAVAVKPSWSSVAAGLFLPGIPSAGGEGLQWTIALMGGVGGTVTVLCYGYWIREEGREGTGQLRTCRIDLATGYAMTALFGLAMVVIGSRIEATGKGSMLIVNLAASLEDQLGAVGSIARWAFLLGAWGAVFSSLLGVWQSVPYLFADFCNLTRGEVDQHRGKVDTTSWAYRGFLYGIASVPAVGLWASFESVQKVYAIFGAAFIPLLAIVLLVLNGRERFIGRANRNSLATTLVLIAAVLFFIASGWVEIQKKLV